MVTESNFNRHDYLTHAPASFFSNGQLGNTSLHNFLSVFTQYCLRRSTLSYSIRLCASWGVRNVGYTAKSGDILFVGSTTQFQFRPDKPWKSEGRKKAPKYRTPVGDYDAFLPQHPAYQDYWDTEKLRNDAQELHSIAQSGQ